MELYLLYAFLILACSFDLKTFKIPNLLVLLFMITGLVFSFLEGGWHTLFSSLISLLITFAIFLPIWIIRIMGAGDIKLLMGISTFLGWQTAFSISYLAIIFAGLIFSFLIRPKYIYQLFNDFFFLIFYKIPLSSYGKEKKLQFSIPIFIAFIVIYHDLLRFLQ